MDAGARATQEQLPTTALRDTQYLREFMRHLFLSLSVLLGSISSAQAAPVCAIDDAGRSVCPKTEVKRVISLSPGSTELIFAAGGGSRVVGVDEHSDYPAEVANIDRIGGYPNISIESIAALKPDLIVAWAGGNSPQLTSMLESIGIPLFYIDPQSFDDVASAIRRLGVVFDTKAHADKSADEVEQRYQAIASQYKNKKPVTVFYEIWNNPLMSINSHHIIHQVIEICGGKNVYADARTQVPQVSIESLIAANPDAISSSTFIKDGKTIEERWSQWRNISAVKNNAYITVSGDQISRPTPRALDAAQEFCEKLEDIRLSSPERKMKSASLKTPAQ